MGEERRGGGEGEGGVRRRRGGGGGRHGNGERVWKESMVKANLQKQGCPQHKS